MGGYRGLRGCWVVWRGRALAAPGGRMLPQGSRAGPHAPRHLLGTDRREKGERGGGDWVGDAVAETHLGLGLRPSASRLSSRRARRSMAW